MTSTTIHLPADRVQMFLDSHRNRTTSQTQPVLEIQGTQTNQDQEANMTDIDSKASVKPTKKNSSFVAVLCDLEVGGTAVRNHSPHHLMTLAQLQEELSEMKAMISNNVRPSVRIATEKTGHQFSVETSQSITGTGRVYVQVIVTRTA